MQTLPHSTHLKLELMFDGIRYSDALGAAASHAFPNFFPYRFRSGEPDPTGQGKTSIPYLLRLDDGTLIRIQGNAGSPWAVSGSHEAGYTLAHRDRGALPGPIEFAPLPGWMRAQTRDGVPMAGTGVSVHGDMAVVNVAPGCQYFLPDRDTGDSMRCTFCTYGRPDARTGQLGQALERVSLPEQTYRRLKETLAAVLAEGGIRHIYLVGGSMRDWHQEGARFVELARQVQQVVQHRVPVTCGSGALASHDLKRLYAERLVRNVCFNLEVWSQALFAKVCPGKHRYVGYERWLESLETAVGLWGPGHVYSAMVAGVELEPEHGMTLEAATALALEGAGELCARGIIPIYSLYWPLGGRERPDYHSNLATFFERLSLGYRDIRRRHGLTISPTFMCHRCAYMQIECDLDRAASTEPVS